MQVMKNLENNLIRFGFMGTLSFLVFKIVEFPFVLVIH